MSFCDIGADNTAFVIATYLIALLPWSILSFWDPINRIWQPFWLVFWKSWIYLIFSILPYFVLIPYTVLQGCSEDSDIKELLTAIVTMVASLWNLLRAVRGLRALQEIRCIWEKVHIKEVARVFHDWLPEERRKGYEVRRIPVVDVLINHSLVDNDWPGEAPQTDYIWNRSRSDPASHYIWNRPRSSPEFDDKIFPPVRAVDSDVIEKQCIVTLWSFWMAHSSPKELRYKEGLLYEKTLMAWPRFPFFRKSVQWILGSKEPSDEQSSKLTEDSQALTSLFAWFRKCFQCITGNKQQNERQTRLSNDSQSVASLVERQTTSDDSQTSVASRVNWFRKYLQRITGKESPEEALPMTALPMTALINIDYEWMCPACQNKSELSFVSESQTGPCNYCILPSLVTRAVAMKKVHYHSSKVLDSVLLNQVSNLPSRVQGELKPSDGARVLHFYRNYFLNLCNESDAERRIERENVEDRWVERENVEDRSNPRCPASRMGLALGLSRLNELAIEKWLWSVAGWDDGTIGDMLPSPSCNTRTKFLSFVVLIRAQETFFKSERWLLKASLMRQFPKRKQQFPIGEIIRAIGFLLHSYEYEEPLDVFEESNKWNALLSSVLEENWRERSRRSKWNTAVRQEFRLLIRILREEATRDNSGDEWTFLPACVACTCKAIKTDPVDFYKNKDYKVVRAKDTIKPLHSDYCLESSFKRGWVTLDDNRKIFWPGELVGRCEAEFEVDNVGQHWKAGFAFRFDCWEKRRAPSPSGYSFVFVISVRDKHTSSVTFESEPVDVRSVKTSSFGDSCWGLLEFRGIPTPSNTGTSTISLSLERRGSYSDFGHEYSPLDELEFEMELKDSDLEIDSFWVTEQMECTNCEEEPWLSAIQKQEN